MVKFRKTALAVGAAIGALALTATAAHAFPGIGADTGGPGLIITFAANGSITTTATGQPLAYDPGGDDAYIGVINDTSSAITSINLSSATLDIFGFDGDGIDVYGGGSNTTDKTGYGGPDAYFTNIGCSNMCGTVNFLNGGIAANGGTGYFSLENQVALNQVVVSGVPEPATWAMMIGGFALMGAGLRSRRKVALAVA
jgi:hypothetical protein